MNSENSKISQSHVLKLKLTSKLDLRLIPGISVNIWFFSSS